MKGPEPEAENSPASIAKEFSTANLQIFGRSAYFLENFVI
jgi:hypothetical protein